MVIQRLVKVWMLIIFHIDATYGLDSGYSCLCFTSGMQCSDEGFWGNTQGDNRFYNGYSCFLSITIPGRHLGDDLTLFKVIQQTVQCTNKR